MDYTTIISSIVTAITSIGGIGALLFYRETKEAKRLENTQKIIDMQSRMIDDIRKRCDGLEREKDEQRDIVSKLRAETDGLRSEVSELRTYRCERVGCVDRIRGCFEPKNMNI